jgi:transketolase
VGIATDHGGFGLKKELITRPNAAMQTFGASAPWKALLREYGLTVDKVAAAARAQVPPAQPSAAEPLNRLLSAVF